MAERDISRIGFNRRKHYDSVRLQQGRVNTDDEFNENERIAFEDRRRSRVDIIGPSGSPDQGFQIILDALNTPGQPINFEISPGTFYLGGLRLELDEKTNYRSQDNWLQQPENLHPAPSGDRFDLVYLEAWQQAVEAVEDNELYEAALGGADTSTRVRTMYRVHLETDVKINDCRQAWGQLVASWKTSNRGVINRENELVPDVSLRVTYSDEEESGNLCTPKAQGGYLGAENQAIRVQLVDSGHLTWGYDNASPLYSVQIDAAGKTVKLLTDPKDQAHWPLAGQIVEILPCSAVLTNNEKIAELTGHISRVDSSYDPATEEITLATPIPNDFCREWAGRSAAGNSALYYMRVWDRGSDTDSAPSIPFSVGTPLKLGHTGLEITISGSDRATGDFWVIAARPETPNKVVPWELEEGSAPHGVRRFYAPLAVIQWRLEQGGISGEVIQDCRKEFPPLTDLPSGCCIYVSPGKSIHEAVTKVKEAGGGCICLLPGLHNLNQPVDLTECSGIHFRGFGRVSRLVISGGLKGVSAFNLSSSLDITFESFVVLNPSDEPVWKCAQASNVVMKSMTALNTMLNRQPLINISDGRCSGWYLENNVFLGFSGIKGHILSNSLFSGNFWMGFYRGVEIKYLNSSRIRGDRFIGIDPKLIVGIEGSTLSMRGGHVAFGKTMLRLIEFAMGAPLRISGSTDYIGLYLSGGFEVDIVDCYFTGRMGIDSDIVEKSTIQRNEFMTTVTAVNCGMVYGLRFSENVIGERATESDGNKGFNCRVGLIILSDAIDCRIQDNSFANVNEGILFESDMKSKKALARDFTVNMLALKGAADSAAMTVLEDSREKAKQLLDKQRLGHSSYFRIGKCEKTLIQGNRFHASQTAIEWSGTKNIIDFRIVNNSFIGCQDVAVQIEPDENMYYLTDPVDTKVRLIEKNRFEVYSGAVRATTGAVRVEKNDIHILSPLFQIIPPSLILETAAKNIYKQAAYVEAVKSGDVPMSRMMVSEVTNMVEKNPGMINTKGFSEDVAGKIFGTVPVNKGDVWADHLSVMKTLADIDAKDVLGTIFNANISRVNFNMEGFAVNMSGLQNRVVHNRIYGNNIMRTGGVVFHVVSGEVRDNEITVPEVALLMSGKFGLSSSYQGAEITGNSLMATGVPGTQKDTYALAIPSLSRGCLSIFNNQLKGAVRIGGDPITANQLEKKSGYEASGKFFKYNVMKLDTQIYHAIAFSKVFPLAEAKYSTYKPIIPLLTVWLEDPHSSRPVIHFSNNRVIRGWVAIFQASSGAYWSKALLKKQNQKALVANIIGNIIDYGCSVVGHQVIMVGNQSQSPIKYRVEESELAETAANIPKALSF